LNLSEKKKSDPLLSVVINCFNGSAYLKNSIDSVIKQSYQNWEIIFWDNRSTDNSSEIFNGYIDGRLHYFLAPTFTSLGEARNLAINKTKGDWVCFLDCDDVWLPEKLERQVSIINDENDDLGIVYGQSLSFQSNTNSNEKWAIRQLKYKNKTILKNLPEGDIFSKLMKLNFISLVTAIVNKQAYYEVGGFSDYFEQSEDYELFVKLAAEKKVRAVQDVIALYRIHDNNNSIGNTDKGFAEVFEVISRYLPRDDAVKGMRYQKTQYSLILFRDGKFKMGLKHFRQSMNFSDVIAIMKRKITRSM
jgi:glycosyltransferase involved in cell wall biosynthesis